VRVVIYAPGVFKALMEGMAELTLEVVETGNSSFLLRVKSNVGQVLLNRLTTSK